MRRRPRSAILAHAHLILLAFIAGAVLSPSPVAASEEIHCVAKAEAVGSVVVSSTPVCFPTFAEAISFATKGALVLPADSSAHFLTDAEVAGAAALSGSTVIGIDYVDTNFSNSTFTWIVDNPNGCFDGSQWVANTIPDPWDHIISSARGFQGCEHFYHYDLPFRGGARIDCRIAFGGCSSMDVMNDQTESEFWSPVGVP